MEMMRHQDITTTQQFYVGRNAEASADVIWDAFATVNSTVISLNQQKTPDISRA